MPIGVSVDKAALRRYREDAGYTRKQLADAIGASVAHIKKLELGQNTALGPEFFAATCRVLRVTPDQIRANTDSDHRTVVTAVSA